MTLQQMPAVIKPGHLIAKPRVPRAVLAAHRLKGWRLPPQIEERIHEKPGRERQHAGR
jgi:hypothetical protein